MFFKKLKAVQFTAVLALAANACSTTTSRPVAMSDAPAHCGGGTLRQLPDALRYANCNAVVGDLRIQASELTDLSALGSLRSVSGTLEISGNPRLEQLTGLERLTSVGALEIRSNADLDSLRGLQNLSRSTKVIISDNPKLGTLRGLESLAEAKSVAIERNGLRQTAGLSNLRAVEHLVVAQNDKLISLAGLERLTRAGTIEIRNNPRLCARLGLLPELLKVDQRIVLESNRGLSTRDVREVMQRVTGSERPGLEGREVGREALLH